MAGILVYALHDDEGNFNKNSLGALSEAAKLAAELGTEAAAVVVGDVSDEGAQGLGNYGVTKVYRAKNVPEGLAQPIVDVMAKVITENGFSYALFGGGLLGFEIGQGRRWQAHLRASDPAGLADCRRRLRLRARHHHRPPQRVRHQGVRRNRRDR